MHDLKQDQIPIQLDALTVFDCLNVVSFSDALETIVFVYLILFKCFNEFSIMFLNITMNVVAHHMVSVSNRLGFKTWLSYNPQVDDDALYLANVSFWLTNCLYIKKDIGL